MDSNKSENSWIPSDLDLVNDASNNFDKSTNSFFSGGIDLIKWTTAIAAAAILWIVTSIDSQHYHNDFSIFLLLGLIFFVLSIITAIFIVIFTLFYWANQMKKYNAMIDVYTSPEFFKILGLSEDNEVVINDRKRSLEEAIKQIRQQTVFHTPINFILLIVGHIGLLVLALISLIVYFVL